MLLAEEDLQMFSNFDEYMREKNVNRQVVTIVQQHLQSLTESFLPKERKSQTWQYVDTIKTRYQSGLEINTALRLAVTSLEPKIHKLISSK
ncbi:hypothetical protein QTO34_006221 [Cnephaeus nilssonii]|uniref:Uncharacterized protein n=1 Tax=Cnephaeus nilssonii TaxID=3371016 RepID=A0AA40HMF4_CNENI|nr:hypothetical protein QTO34_006221 [Eptesicus nilssonii]